MNRAILARWRIAGGRAAVGLPSDQQGKQGQHQIPCAAEGPAAFSSQKRRIGPKNASFDAPLSVAKMTIPAVVSIRYKKIRLEGSGAECGRLGTINFKNR